MAAQPALLSAPARCIRDTSWIVAWDPSAAGHVYRRGGDVAWIDDRLVQVGGRFEGPVAEEIDGTGRLVLPGLINVHCHPSQSAIFRGLVEEFGNPRLFYSNRHRFRQGFQHDAEAQLASARFALAEMLTAGITTIVDLSHAYPGWLDLLAESGIRACVAPMFRSARWWTDTGQETRYEWLDDLGRSAFEEAVAVMDAADTHPSGRLFSMVSPAQVDTCTPELLQAAAALARKTGRPLHVHAAQSYAEFNGMTRRHDMTPIEWLEKLGFLGSDTILGHAVFTDEHPWLVWPTRRDLGILSRTGTSIAHCPTVFARDGTLLHHLGAYLDAGINIAIGTDTHPHNILEEIRTAEILARVAAGPRHSTSTARLFHCATSGAAAALGRDDIGRLVPGAQADIVACALDEPTMQPVHDPLRSLVHSAADRAVRDVWVDGRRLVQDGRVLTIDWHKAGRDLESAQQRSARAVPGLDAIVPLSLPLAPARGETIRGGR